MQPARGLAFGGLRALAPALALLLALGCCAGAPPALSLRFLGSATVARQADGPLRDFGGISGIDHDAATGLWYLLSDDRSALAPARFYTATIELDASGLRAVRVHEPVTLRQPDGSPFPNAREHGVVPDPEALRIDPRDGQLAWSSEGDRRIAQQPFVRRASRDGRFAGELPLPANLRMHPDAELGARHNLSLEGLAFTPDGSSLWMAMEGPLFQDGPLPSLRAGAHARFTRVDRQGKVLAQYAYPVDAIPMPAAEGLRADNGVAEILARDDATLLVVERSGREVEPGVFRFAVRLYEASVAGATDVQAVDSLQRAAFAPMHKRLLLDLSTAGIDGDNVEAAAWGPLLSDGRRSLVLVSDDNFHPRQASRFLAFEVMP